MLRGLVSDWSSVSNLSGIYCRIMSRDLFPSPSVTSTVTSRTVEGGSQRQNVADSNPTPLPPLPSLPPSWKTRPGRRNMGSWKWQRPTYGCGDGISSSSKRTHLAVVYLCDGDAKPAVAASPPLPSNLKPITMLIGGRHSRQLGKKRSGDRWSHLGNMTLAGYTFSFLNKPTGGAKVLKRRCGERSSGRTWICLLTQSRDYWNSKPASPFTTECLHLAVPWPTLAD